MKNMDTVKPSRTMSNKMIPAVVSHKSVTDWLDSTQEENITSHHDLVQSQEIAHDYQGTPPLKKTQNQLT